MNEILFKNADERIIKVVELIKDAIKLTKFEGKVYLTGGCIRDLLLNKKVNDLDIVVEERNGGMIFSTFLALRHKCFAENTNPKIYPNSNAARLQLFNNEELKDIIIECSETRKKKVSRADAIYDSAFGTLEEDAKVRDLTMNAMHYNISTDQLHDLNGTAIDDMLCRRLKTPGNPSLVLREDPIKILRIIRFSTQLGWDIEKNTWLAMIENAHRINEAPQEAITNEITKILLSEKPSRGLMKMYLCGVLDKVMPDIYDMNSAYESKNPMVTTFEHTLKVVDMVQPYIEHRLAALFHDVGKIITDGDRTVSPDQFSADVTQDELKRMKYPNYVAKAASLAIRYHRIFKMYGEGSMPPDKKIRKFINLCGDDIGVVVDLMNANNTHCTYGKNPKQVLNLLNRIEELEKEEENTNIKLPINGNDIMKEFNLKGGPYIGTLLNAVKEAYFDNPNITKDECYEVVEKELKLLV